MKIKLIPLILLLASSLLFVNCTPGPSGGRGAARGAAAGAAIGAVAGGEGDRAEGALIGGAGGALIGGAVGRARERRAYEDRHYHDHRGGYGHGY